MCVVRRETTLVVRVLLISLFTCSTVLAQNGGQCRSATVVKRLDAQDRLILSIGDELRLQFRPMKNDSGWQVSVSPREDETEDWTYPVNMPLRTGESQFLATGYGQTVRERLRYAHEIKFLLNKEDFARWAREADETLESSDAKAAGAYIAHLRQASTGLLVITPEAYETTPDGQAVRWARLKIEVTVPASFAGSRELNWEERGCPSQSP
jgi:hypothetical protein